MFCAAVSVSVGVEPPTGVAAAKNLSHASPLTRVVQPASKFPSVLNVAMLVVCELFRGSRITGPKPPVVRSTRLGTLPAAIRRPSACPLITVPSMNCACVHTEAMVVNSLITTLDGGSLPSTAISVMRSLSPAVLSAGALPPCAIRYRLASCAGASAELIAKLPSASVTAQASCTGAAAVAAQSVTVARSTGPPPLMTWPFTSPVSGSQGPGELRAGSSASEISLVALSTPSRAARWHATVMTPARLAPPGQHQDQTEAVSAGAAA